MVQWHPLTDCLVKAYLQIDSKVLRLCLYCFLDSVPPVTTVLLLAATSAVLRHWTGSSISTCFCEYACYCMFYMIDHFTVCLYNQQTNTQQR